MQSKPVPEGYHTVTPCLSISGASDAIEFYKKAFGAKERFRMAGPDGKIAHAEIEINGSAVFIGEEYPNMGAKSPKTLGGSASGIYLYVPNVDEMVKNATAAGAKVVQPITDKFYGDRTAYIVDPFGHNWHIATHIEDVPKPEMERRMKKMMEESAAKK